MRIKDSYFGKMGSIYDKIDNCYCLDKDIELDPIHTPVTLYIESKNQQSNNDQQEAFESIQQNFPRIWDDIIAFLSIHKKIITIEQLRKEYRLESITIPIDIAKDKVEWEASLLNIKDGFSRIVIELRNNEPFHFSVEG